MEGLLAVAKPSGRDMAGTPEVLPSRDPRLLEMKPPFTPIQDSTETPSSADLCQSCCCRLSTTTTNTSRALRTFT
eukprot:1356195-Pleurochrysis_carterae.AAC.1